MASRLNPYLSFTDTAREAMEFYRSVFGGELSVSSYGDFGHAEGEGEDLVMHAQLETPQGFTLMGADMPPGMGMQPSAGVWISLSGDDQELRGWFSALAEGGTVHNDLAVQVWGDEFGQLVDRFGIGWMVNIARPPE
ncbi:MAG: VOC family protein [Nocardioides sp.]